MVNLRHGRARHVSQFNGTAAGGHHRPARRGALRGWGVFSHGFTLGKDSPAAARICKQLADDGIGMLRFDALGLGDSEGDWGDGSFTVKVNDVIRACEFMAEQETPADILVGHSFGGAAVIAAARTVTRRAGTRHGRSADGSSPCGASSTTRWLTACCPKAVPSG